MNREEEFADAYQNYLEYQSDLGLAGIFYNTMSKLLANVMRTKCIVKDYNIKEFVRKEELINIITELDFTGKLDVTGFEDIRNKI